MKLSCYDAGTLVLAFEGCAGEVVECARLCGDSGVSFAGLVGKVIDARGSGCDVDGGGGLSRLFERVSIDGSCGVARESAGTGCADVCGNDVASGGVVESTADCPAVDGSTRAGGGSFLASEQPGRWAASNRRKKERRRAQAAGVPEWRRRAAPVGFCETLVSGGSAASNCPSYGQALSDAEKEAKESLARRRAAENALKEKLAKLKLAELEDEKRCAEVADLKHQRIIQWTNEATAKSQECLDKVKSIDPSSSASQYEIRQQAKKLADAESDNRRLCSIVKTLSPDWQELIERKAESTFNTEYVDELMALGAAGRDNGFNY